ncbi:ABC transporter ATP-binding protein [Haloferacaceae archaeon DSL9]
MRKPSSGAVVTCDTVSQRYRLGRGSEDGDSTTDRPIVRALSSVSLAIDRGEIVGLAGPSGSGKTSLLNLLGGLDTATSGTVTFGETDLGSLSERERTRHRLENVGIVFQHFHLLDALSARANVALPLVEQGRPKSERRERASDLLERVGLGDRLTHKPSQLSGGEQQRVAIARALITDPALVIADEPTGELDTETGNRVCSLFRELATDRDAAIVIASHDEPTLEVCDRICWLRDGELVDETRPLADAGSANTERLTRVR